MSEPTEQPTLADVLAAVQSLAAGQGAIARRQDDMHETITALSGDVQGLKLDFAAYTQLAEARHVETKLVLEEISGLVHEQQRALGQTESRLRSRIGDVQGVVQALKEDLAAHTSDPNVHHP